MGSVPYSLLFGGRFYPRSVLPFPRMFYTISPEDTTQFWFFSLEDLKYLLSPAGHGSGVEPQPGILEVVVRLLVGARAWVVGSVPGWRCVGGSRSMMTLSSVVFLSVCLSLSLSEINKDIFEEIK